jgi:hypothetical protein
MEDFARVNILVGQNNCGKSTVLEALLFATGMSNPYLPQRLNAFRSRNIFSGVDSLKYLFRNMDLARLPRISASQFDGGTRELELSLGYKTNSTVDSGVSMLSSETQSSLNAVVLDFAVNGKKLGAVELLTELNEIGARNGVGIVDICENRLVGMKSRGVYENPGGALLYYAHRELEYLCLDRSTYHYKQQVGIRYAELVYDGMWFCQLREALDAFVNSTQQTVTGQVKLKLYKGNIISAGSTSPYSLYSQEFVTFEHDDVYNQADATGFINLFGLPLKVRALMQEKTGK